jgi:hypothetical protein
MSATAGKEPRDKAAAVADLGKSLGFDFTADEAILIRGAARKALIGEGKLDEELDDLDLQAVTGGATFAQQNPVAARVIAQAAEVFTQMGGPAKTGYVFSAGVKKGTENAENGGGLEGFARGFADGVKQTTDTISDGMKSFFSGW